MKQLFSRRLLAFCAAASFTALASAQTWPSKPVRLIVPYPVGTANEVFARVVAQKLSIAWGQSVVVDAIPGADGYTLGWVSSPHAINAALYRTLPYDTAKDFRAIVNIASTPLVFVAGAGFKANNIGQLLAMAKAEPGKIDFASNGNGSASHLATALMASMAGVKFTHVPYKATGQMTTDLVSGQVQFAALGVITSQSLIQSGKLKALGVTGSRRAPLLPDVPTVAETVPGYEAKAWMGLVAPAGTPDAVAARVQADAEAVVRDPAVLKTMAAQGLDAEILEGPQFARRIETDIKTWTKIVDEAGVKIE